jgi:hypothetical protein
VPAAPTVTCPVPASVSVGSLTLRRVPWPGLGIIVDGLVDPPGGVTDYVDDLLLAPAHRDAFIALIDQVGLVVCRSAPDAPTGGKTPTHRDVRGRSSRGRLSQGEYFHHDGCAGPTKPRVVEISCPVQAVPRHTATAIAPFDAVLQAMLALVPARLCTPELAELRARVERGERFGDADEAAAEHVQGQLNRVLRRGLPAEDTRSYFRDVDVAAGAFREPWTMGERRFIANAGAARTMQHRRAYLAPVGGAPCGSLIKRWPVEELAGQIVCDRGD